MGGRQEVRRLHRRQARLVCGTFHDHVDRPSASCSSFVQNSMNRSPVKLPVKVENRNRPWALTAETMFGLCQLPVAFTIGVCPPGAQVVPAW